MLRKGGYPIQFVLVLTFVIANAFHFKASTFLPGSRLFAKPDQGIYYAPNFQRHVVIERTANKAICLESFLWLDEAKASYPQACTLWNALKSQSVIPRIAGGGLEEDTAYNEGVGTHGTKKHLDFSMTACNETFSKYQQVVKMLTGRSSDDMLLNRFHPLDRPWIRERILFALSPFARNVNAETTDWAQMFSRGYGVGLTELQVATIIRALPHFLAIHQIESSRVKPSLPFLYQQLKVPFNLIDQARVELDHWLTGATPADVASLAFIHSLDVSWDQCRSLLGALSSSFITCELDPGWELYESGPVRSVLLEDSLLYLRMRLQLTPSEIFALIKTHPRLSSYSVQNHKLHVDALQEKLKLTSHESRTLILRTPFLLGVSLSKLDDRINFLSQEVNMTNAEIRRSVLKQPALLQYSIESNLRPKLNYLINELQIPQANLTSMVLANPSILGRSLERKIRPTTEWLVTTCNLSPNEVGAIFVKVPQLLSLSQKTNLEPKTIFLRKRLGLSKSQFRTLLKTAPRVLVHSVETSLKPKLKMLEQAANGQRGLASKAVLDNPSLLLTNMSVLKKRLADYQRSNATWLEAFSLRRNGKALGGVSRQRRKRPVLELIDGKPVQLLSDVKAAAESSGTSVQYMYNIIRNERVFKGKQYVFETNSSLKVSVKKEMKGDSSNDTTVSAVDSINEKESDRQPRDSKKSFFKDLRRHYIPDGDEVSLVDALRRSKSDASNSGQSNATYLAVFVAGRSYPPEKAEVVRGRRKAGGLSIYFPQVKGTHFGKILRAASERCLEGQIIHGGEGGTNFHEGMILLGYPYLRPSRNRCGLYVCRDALRIILEMLLLQRSCPNLPYTKLEVDIFTDSPYVWDLLQNSTRLLQWGSYSRKDDFIYDGDGPEWAVHPDILYPLSRTYYRLAKQLFVPIEGDSGTSSVAKEVKIQFLHKSDLMSSSLVSSDFKKAESIGELAALAAACQYERAQKSLIL